jgi:hypothetical protein
MSRLLKKYNFKLLKSGSLPAMADPEKQRTFYLEVLLPLMEKAKKGTIALLSVDAAHFVMGWEYLSQIWYQTRRYPPLHDAPTDRMCCQKRQDD